MAGGGRNVRVAGRSFVRVTGGAIEVNVKATAGVLHRIIMFNGDAAAQTLLVENGATDALVSLGLPAGESRTFEFETDMTLGIRVTPSDAAVDACIVFS